MPASVALLVLVLMYWHFHRGRLVFVTNAHQKLRPDLISHILICYYFLAFCYFSLQFSYVTYYAGYTQSHYAYFTRSQRCSP